MNRLLLVPVALAAGLLFLAPVALAAQPVTHTGRVILSATP